MSGKPLYTIYNVLEGKNEVVEITEEINRYGKPGKIVPRPDLEPTSDMYPCDGYTPDGDIIVGRITTRQMHEIERGMLRSFQSAMGVKG